MAIKNFATLVEKWEEDKYTPKAASTVLANGQFISFKVVTFGDSTTQFDITNPAGTTFRYTYDGTGTDPVINATTVPVGTIIVLNAQNFATANKGTFVVTGSGANYLEVSNALGVVESNKTIGTGSITTSGGVKPAVATEALLGVGQEDVLSTDVDFTSTRQIAYQTAYNNYFEVVVTAGTATAAMVGLKFNLDTPSTISVAATGTQLEITKFISATRVQVKIALIA